MEFGKTEQEVLEKIMVWRRDVRGQRFTSKPVSPDITQALLKAAVLAPSVGYSQPWRFVIVDDIRLKQQVRDSFETANSEASERFHADSRREDYRKLKLEGILEAPINLAVFYDKGKGPVLGQNSMPETGPYSVVCAIQNIWLMARAHNLGLGWVSILDPEEVGQILGAPPETKLIAYLCIGYVDQYAYEPELKNLGWEKEVALENVIFKNGFHMSRPDASI